MKTTLCIILLALTLQADTAPQSLKLSWNGSPIAIYNIRIYNPPTSIINDYATWPVAYRITNALTLTINNVNPTQFYAISVTNPIAGTEDTAGLSPVSAVYSWQ